MSVAIPIGKEGGKRRSNEEVENLSKAPFVYVAAGGPVGKGRNDEQYIRNNECKSDTESVKQQEEENNPTEAQVGQQFADTDAQEENQQFAGIDALLDQQFDNIDELHDKLESLGLSDTKLILDSDGFAIMPTPEHNRATKFIHGELTEYSRGWFMFWGLSGCKNRQNINTLTPQGRRAHREPDVGFWLPEKCEFVESESRVRLVGNTTEEVDPDVFFEFSWTSTEEKEFSTVNELLNESNFGPGNMGGPRVGILIKVDRPGGISLGIKVYKVLSGCTIQDALDGTNGCTYQYYDHQNYPNNNDVKLVITPEEFGYNGFLSRFYANFNLSLRTLFIVAALG